MKSLIRTARTTLAYILMTAGVSLPVFGTLYTGTITETVTWTTSPTYQVGQTFLGYYEYESPTIDGDFGTPFYAFENPSALPTLFGSIYGFLGVAGEAAYLAIREGSPFTTHLKVSEGIVTEFHYDGQRGGADYFFSVSDFTASYIDFSSPGGPTREIRGTVSFSAPVAVPDSAGTAGLLAGVIFLGAVVRKRWLTSLRMN